MRNIIKLITVTILTIISFSAISAQEANLVSVNGNPIAAEKIEKKAEPAKKRQPSGEDPWTGFYIGGFGGYTNGRTNAITSTSFVTNGYFDASSINPINTAGNKKLSSHGFNGGVTAGYNYQKDNFFIGAEFDFGTHRVSKTTSSTAAYPCCVTTNFTVSQTVKSDWMMTVRPRVGFASKKALVYTTGGMAMANVKYDARFTDTFGPALETGSFKETKIGWAAGAGLEFKASNRWSVKGEYLYSQFGRTSITVTGYQISPTGSRGVNPFAHSSDLKSHNLRFGVNYRF